MAPAAEQGLRRVQDVTANYFLWQGLRLIPMGAVWFFVALRWSPWWPLLGSWSDGAFLALCALALLGSSAVGRYYKRTFGHVRALPGQHARRDAIKWILAYPALLAALIVDAYLQPPVLVSGVAWAVAVLAYWHSTGRGRPHYVWGSALLLLLGLAPTAGFFPSGRASLAQFFGFLGILYVVGGLLDHRELRRVLPPLPPETVP
jgi:hypothetical protein